MFISCPGFSGLSAYMAERRTRGIGIRKVLGASVGQVHLFAGMRLPIMMQGYTRPMPGAGRGMTTAMGGGVVRRQVGGWPGKAGACGCEGMVTEMDGRCFEDDLAAGGSGSPARTGSLAGFLAGFVMDSFRFTGGMGELMIA